MNPARWKIAAAITTLLWAAQASAFDPHEHKKAGDDGSAAVLADPAARSTVERLNPQGNRWLKVAAPGDDVCASLASVAYNLSSSARKAIDANSTACTTPNALAVWVGRGRAGKWVTFGDLVAIYGDFRGDVDAMLSTPRSTIVGLQQITRSGLVYGKDIGAESVENTAWDSIGSRSNFRSDFYDLAPFNKTHFHVSAVRAYATHHLKALELVALAAQTNDPKPLWLAMHHEALAQHGLTDLFAGGHILVDRRLAVSTLRTGAFAWLKSKLSRGLQRIANMIGAALDGLVHNMINSRGMWAETMEGKRFRAWGDGSSTKPQGPAPHISAAVGQSLASLFQAYHQFAQDRSAIPTRFRALARGPAFSALRLLPIRLTGALPGLLYEKLRDSVMKIAAPFLSRLGPLQSKGRSTLSQLLKQMGGRRIEVGRVPYADLVRSLLAGRTSMQRSASFSAAAVAGGACKQMDALQIPDWANDSSRLSRCVADLLREKTLPEARDPAAAAAAQGVSPECITSCGPENTECLRRCRHALEERAAREKQLDEEKRRRQAASRDFSQNVCARGGDWLAVCNLYRQVSRCWPHRTKATRNPELIRIVRTLVQGQSYRDFSAEEIRRLRLEGEAAAAWCRGGKPFRLPAAEVATASVAAPSAGPAPQWASAAAGGFASAGERNALDVLARGEAPGRVPACLLGRQRRAYLAAVAKPAYAITTAEARLILEVLRLAGFIELRQSGGRGSTQLERDCSLRRFSEDARVDLGPWVRFSPGRIRPADPRAEAGRVGFVYNPLIKRVGRGGWNRAAVKKAIDWARNVHPRFALALYRLASHLGKRWGVTEIHHAGIARAGTDEHGQGRAIDFAGVSGLDRGSYYELFVYHDWGTKAVPADRRQRGWPAHQWKHQNGITSYRLAGRGDRAAGLFADFYRQARSQFTTTGPESLGTGGLIRGAGRILHPDYSKSSPASSPARTPPPNGREAHANHVHLPIDADVSAYVASGTASPAGLAGSVTTSAAPSPSAALSSGAPTMPAAPERPPSTTGATRLYLVRGNGTLLWNGHLGPSDGRPSWSAQAPRAIGQGWSFRHVFAGPGGVLYGVDGRGRLLWYRHRQVGGRVLWEGPRNIGSGWGIFKHLFAGPDKTLYGVTQQGVLLWYRHLGQNDGTPRWQNRRLVGRGWGGFKHVFAGPAGVLYAVNKRGSLLWIRHLGQRDGTPRWVQIRRVGTGWGHFGRVFAGPGRAIYAVDSRGAVRWYRHDGQSDGSMRWGAGSGRVIGGGWGGASHAFAEPE